MRKFMKKLHSAHGETLVEVLAAVLICSLAVLLLVSYATAAARIDKNTEKGDEAYYTALNAAEAHAGVTAEGSEVPAAPVEGTVSVSDGTMAAPPVSVLYYGGDGVYSYAIPAPTPDLGGGT